jgi:hypothetical protein
MDTLFATISIVIVIAVLATVAFSLFEVSPLAHHGDVFHKPGERQNSPRLD